MLHAETVKPTSLDQADVAAWRRLCESNSQFASPLLGPEFALAVEAVRDDVWVAVWRNDGRAVGFLPHHRRPGGLARPIGAPFSDYHALVAEPGLDVAQALGAAGIHAYRFTGLIDPYDAFAGFTAVSEEAHVIALSGSADDYLEALRAASAKRFKNYRRLDHKIDRELGALRIVAPDDSRAAFDMLMDWKRAQLIRTRAHDVLRPDWTRRLMSNLFELREGAFRGLMICLYAGDRLVAGHFGVRLGQIYHPWIASMDPDLAAWSPGQVFLPRAISAMPGLGLTAYDLGPTHDHYKRPFALATRAIAAGLATADNAGGRRSRGIDRMLARIGAGPSGPLHGVRRRLDAIATVEPSLGGRARSLAATVASRARKSAAYEE